MRSVNIHEAKTTFSRLIDAVVGGEEIVVAKAGRPVARLVPYETPASESRLGFLEGRIVVPDDFDEWDVAELLEADDT